LTQVVDPCTPEYVPPEAPQGIRSPMFTPRAFTIEPLQPLVAAIDRLETAA
jgi:hypothetical protein